MIKIEEITIFKVENGFVVKCFVWDKEKEDYRTNKTFIFNNKKRAVEKIDELLDTEVEEEVKY